MLKPGDIVTDLDPQSMYKGKQGVVRSVQFCFWDPPEVLVRFDRELYPFYLGDDECPNGVCDIYPPHELRLDEDWEPQVYARRIFKNNWHSLSTLKKPLNHNTLCMVEGCPHYQTKIAWVNIWGSVSNVYVCKEHAREYKKYSCMDIFPHRRHA